MLIIGHCPRESGPKSGPFYDYEVQVIGGGRMLRFSDIYIGLGSEKVALHQAQGSAVAANTVRSSADRQPRPAVVPVKRARCRLIAPRGAGLLLMLSEHFRPSFFRTHRGLDLTPRQRSNEYLSVLFISRDLHTAAHLDRADWSPPPVR
jgi:hypothetical protein